MADPIKVHQILMNLCANTAHAMPKGGVMEVGLLDERLHSEEDGKPREGTVNEFVKLTVSDTGVGIPPEILHSIFDPYFTTKARGEGSGMGLAVVRGIVEKYCGRIAVESEPGKGSVFTICLPTARSFEEEIAFPTEQPPRGTERILFVDDELSIASMSFQALNRLGYQIVARTGVLDAIDLFRANPNDFDLVVTGMTMPSMNGDKFAIALMETRPDIPVILCTGCGSAISKKTAEEIGIKEILFKPITKMDLAKAVRKVLDDARGARGGGLDVSTGKPPVRPV